MFVFMINHIFKYDTSMTWALVECRPCFMLIYLPYEVAFLSLAYERSARHGLHMAAPLKVHTFVTP